jgi:hypothetical protein
MTRRKRLPNRRESVTEEFNLAGLRCVTTFGFYSDGKLAEIFLRAGKPGSAADIAAHDSAVTASLALQFGVPAEAIRHALERLSDGSGAGPLGRALDLLDGPGGLDANASI